MGLTRNRVPMHTKASPAAMAWPYSCVARGLQTVAEEGDELRVEEMHRVGG